MKKIIIILRDADDRLATLLTKTMASHFPMRTQTRTFDQPVWFCLQFRDAIHHHPSIESKRQGFTYPQYLTQIAFYIIVTL